MSKLLFLLSFTILLGCSHQQPKNKINTNNLINHDTIIENDVLVSNDSTIRSDSLITKEQKEKELIDDFYGRFSSDNDFQISRVKFPLEMQIGDQVSTIQKKDWKHDYLFLPLQYATYILDYNNSGIDYGADYGDKSIFSWIYPSLNKKKDYYFIRENCQWYLSKIVISTINSEDPESFIKFLQRFMNDSIFQISRTKFPFKINTWTGSEEESKDTTYLIKQSQWRNISLYNGLDSLTNFSNDWNSDIKNKDKLDLFLAGVENGISISYYFQKLDKKWFIIGLKDYSD
jgi:hypothetical protein